MTEHEAFQLGFLTRCAEEGLTAAQAAARARDVWQHAQQFPKAAAGDAAGGLTGYLTAPLTAVKSVTDAIAGVAPLAHTVGAIGVGLPILAGGAGGYALARLTDDDTDIDQARSDETVAEYRRLTDHLRRQQQLRRQQHQGSFPGSGVRA